MDDLTRKRMELNEEVFKTVNEEIEDRADEGRALEYVCECADTACNETIRLTHAEYRHVRSEANWYAVLDGHQVPEVEHVVESHGAYLIVEKS